MITDWVLHEIETAITEVALKTVKAEPLTFCAAVRNLLEARLLHLWAPADVKVTTDGVDFEVTVRMGRRVVAAIIPATCDQAARRQAST